MDSVSTNFPKSSSLFFKLYCQMSANKPDNILQSKTDQVFGKEVQDNKDESGLQFIKLAFVRMSTNQNFHSSLHF